MNKKCIAVAACIAMALMMFAPLATPVKAGLNGVSNMNVLQYRYFGTQDALFTALLASDDSGGIDTMQWPLTQAQYVTIRTSNAITVEPLDESGEFEIAFNNNWTDGINMGVRSPMNYTDFRNALNCLVDRIGMINGPILEGYAVPCYTQVPVPLMAAYVNNAVSGSNYPWAFNVTHALQILWSGGWYNHAIYPTLNNLITAYGNGNLAAAMGTGSGVVYSGNDPNGQWGGGDPEATANSGVTNTPIAALQGYVRNKDARKDLGDFFNAALVSIGCPDTETYEPTLTALRPFVLDAQTYDWATLGYSFCCSVPEWWCPENTFGGNNPNGLGPYLIQDANITHYAYAASTDQTEYQFNLDQQTVQYNLVWESCMVPVYCPATYCAYKTGLLGQVDILGQGTGANDAQTENWITLDTKKNTTVKYTGAPSGTPTSNILYLGLCNPPDQLNPVFQNEQYDFQVTDEIFTYPIAHNPYTIAGGSAITGSPSGGDLPWMAYCWKTQLINDPYNAANPQWTNVTFWFRHDITWQDGVPFTVADVNYTIYVNALYGDAWDHGSMVNAANVSSLGPDARYQAQIDDPNYAAPYFTEWDPYTCSILVSSPSWLSLDNLNCAILPYHLYKYIVPSSMTAAEQGLSTDGLHGLWPGQAAAFGNVLSGAPFTETQLNNNPETTLVGTGPWYYRVGSTNAGEFAPSGAITLDTYTGFFMPIAPGAIAFKYTWLNTAPSAQPSGGYFKIGLSDLVYLANAYGTTGTPGNTVPLSGVPGNPHTWNPAADLAAPSGVIGLSDLVTLAVHYGWYWGNYSYNAPYPPSEVANGGPDSVRVSDQSQQSIVTGTTNGPAARGVDPGGIGIHPGTSN